MQCRVRNNFHSLLDQFTILSNNSSQFHIHWKKISQHSCTFLFFPLLPLMHSRSLPYSIYYNLYKYVIVIARGVRIVVINYNHLNIFFLSFSLLSSSLSLHNNKIITYLNKELISLVLTSWHGAYGHENYKNNYVDPTNQPETKDVSVCTTHDFVLAEIRIARDKKR